MTEYIADDFSYIRKKMEELSANHKPVEIVHGEKEPVEQKSTIGPAKAICSKCYDSGWTTSAVGAVECTSCGNPYNKPYAGDGVIY